MPRYICNKNAQSNGDHEVHNADTCIRLPLPVNQLDLGYHANCRTAVAQAKLYDRDADGCAYCSPECHTR